MVPFVGMGLTFFFKEQVYAGTIVRISDDFQSIFFQANRRRIGLRRMTMPDNSIHVDFLAPESHGLPGRLGLTIAPGKWRPGLDHASDTLVRDDLLRLRDFYRTKVLVTLLEEFEMRKLAIPEPAVDREEAAAAEPLVPHPGRVGAV